MIYTYYKHELKIPWIEKMDCYECGEGWHFTKKTIFRWGKYTEEHKETPFERGWRETQEMYIKQVNEQLFGDKKVKPVESSDNSK